MLALTLVGCGKSVETTTSDTETTSPEEAYQSSYYNDEDPLTNGDLELGQGVVLNDFAQRQAIGSPLELSGVAPRYWFFEGIVPITIMTLEEEIVAEGYGSGAWLEPLPGEDELGANDPVAFTATIEFTAPPLEVDMGKIRIAQDATGSDETGIAPAYVETMILWE